MRPLEARSDGSAAFTTRALTGQIVVTRDGKIGESGSRFVVDLAARQRMVGIEADLGWQIERDGQAIARVPESGKNPYGRPVFQNLQYSDTPTQPLVKMAYTDPNPVRTSTAWQAQLTWTPVNTGGFTIQNLVQANQTLFPANSIQLQGNIRFQLTY